VLAGARDRVQDAPTLLLVGNALALEVRSEHADHDEEELQASADPRKLTP
jgi:hypothetical protein